MKKLFLTIVALSVAIMSSGWTPSLKYAKWVERFSLDKVWQFDGGSTEKCNDVVKGCYLNDYPGAISWCMMSWDERVANSDDYNMEWAEVYIRDVDDPNAGEKMLCHMIPQGNWDDNGWTYNRHTDYSGCTTYCVHEVFRSRDDDCGMLFFTTFYGDEVRNFIQQVKNNNHRLGIRFKTQWDDTHWNEYNETATLDNDDQQFLALPPAPSVTNLGWSVKDNKTSLAFSTDASPSGNYKMYMEDGRSDRAEIDLNATVKYFTPNNISGLKDNFHTNYQMPVTAYTEYSYSYNKDYYRNATDVNNLSLNTTLRSVTNNVTAPAMIHPSSLSITDTKNGNTLVSWSVPASVAGADQSMFKLERATNSNFTTNLASYDITYNPNQTYYTCKDTFGFRENGNVQFYYRIRRGNSTFAELGTNANQAINTEYATLKRLEASIDTTSRKVKLVWDFNSGILEKELKVKITSPSVVGTIEVLSNGERFKDNITIPQCSPTSFTAQLAVGNNTKGSSMTSNTVTLMSNQNIIDTVIVSTGYFNDRVHVRWTVNSQHKNFNSFEVYRKEVGTDKSTALNVGSINYTTGVLNYTITDMNAVPGVYYDYYVKGLSMCDTVPSAIETPCYVGFAQATGAVSGQITFNGNQASSGVAVVVSGEGRFQGKSLAFIPSHKPRLTIPQRFISKMFGNGEGTMEFFVKLNDSRAENTLLKYKDNLLLKVNNGQMTLRIKDAQGSNHTLTVNYPAEALFNHVAIAYHTVGTNRQCLLYINGDTAGVLTYPAANSYAVLNDTTGSLYIGSDGALQYLDGYIDEIRFWNIYRPAEEIMLKSISYLNGTENGLQGYYRCDDDVAGMIYDISKNANTFNGRHLKLENIAADPNNVPTPEQLSFLTRTDDQGHYLLTNIPYSHSGTSYTIVPLLGVHEFSPASRPLYFSSTASTHNSIDFTDVSSFKVSGVVYYENTNYPVEGCSFTIDGTTTCMKDGELIKTNANGEFTIEVPIGEHFIKVSNGNHKFVNRGRFPATGVFNFEEPMTNLTFTDSTYVLVTGRVSGGSDEAQKPHGFSIGKATIGKAKVVIAPVGEIYNLNKNENNQRTFLMPEDSVKGTCRSIATTGPATANNAKNITIITDSVTGEFNVMLPPLNYTVKSVEVLNNRDNISFSKSSMPSLNLTEQDVSKTNKDSLALDSTHYNYFRYAGNLDVIHYSYPTMTRVQGEGNNELPAIGARYYYYTDPVSGLKDTVDLWTVTPDSIRYTFNYPCFYQGDVYTWKIHASERYVNYDNRQHPDTTLQPFRYGIVTVDNNYGTQQKNKASLTDTTVTVNGTTTVTVSGNELLLDSMGNTYYTFQVGDPILFSPYTSNALISFQDMERTREYEWSGNKYNQAIIFGSKIRGTTFTTKAPDEVFYILRDPVGADSYASWSAGQTVTKYHYSSGGFQRQADWGWEFSVGVSANLVIAPMGAGTYQQVETSDKVGPYAHYEGSSVWYDEETTTFVNQQTVSTSDDHEMVGACADVYIGKAKNYLTGFADQLTIKRDSVMDKYSIVKRDAIAVGEEYTTQFNYSQHYIETTLLPDLKNQRDRLLLTVSQAQYNSNYPNATDSTIYITTLQPSDPDFGKDSTYICIYPDDTTKINYDEVHNFNNDIAQWIGLMADNEHAKAIVHHSTAQFDQSLWANAISQKAWYDLAQMAMGDTVDTTYSVYLDDIVNNYYTGGWLLGNYSVGEGAPFSQSQTSTVSTIGDGKKESNNFIIGVSSKFSVAIGKNGTSMTVKGGVGGTFESEDYTNTANTTAVTYSVLMDNSEALSFDVYQSPDGFGPIFCTRGGQTFCPYEAEDSTKYYRNSQGQKVELQTRTIPMAKPSITTTTNRVINVPVGQKALFNIHLGNEATTTQQIDFVVCENPQSNPNGAIIKMDGAAVSYSGFLVSLSGGEHTNKVLEIQQTRPDILNYDSIMIIFKTDCYKFDADTIYLTAHFIPTCSDIALDVDKQIINNTTGNAARFTIDGYTPDFRNFKGIQLQFRTEGSVTWTTLKSWLKSNPTDSATLANGIIYHNLSFDMPAYPDGEYEFRAVTLCQSGNETITNESAIVNITADRSAPASMGTPYPIDGIYSIASQIYVDFNEPIQTGRVLRDNVTAEGVLNSYDISDHSISIDLENNDVHSSAAYDLDSVPFTIEMWINYTAPGTIWSYANTGNKGVSFGIDASNKFKAVINGVTLLSDSTMQPGKWLYLVASCDPVAQTLDAAYAYNDRTVVLFSATPVTAVSTRGNIKFGGNGLKAKIHDVSLWNIIRPWTTAISERKESKSPYTPGIISIWRMNEGSGKMAADCIRQRNLTLSADAWAYNYSNFALNIPAGSTASMNISACPIPEGKSYLFEMWFRAMGNGRLFRLDNNSLTVDVRNNNLVINNISYPIVGYTDSTWHHLALISKNTSYPIVSVDGVQVATYASLTELPPFQSTYVIFGTDTAAQTCNIDIDEVRLWNLNTSLEAVRQTRKACMRGNEAGLLAYYPMERTLIDQYNQVAIQFSLYDKTDTTNFSDMRSLIVNGSAGQSSSSPALIESRPVEYVAHTYTTSENKIMVNITEPAARIEGCTIEFTVKDIVDRNGNYSEPIRWTAFVNRNQLVWDENNISIVKDELRDTTFNLVVINNGSQAQSWTIDNVPNWMTLSQTSGYLQPLQRETVTCTINSSLARGRSEHILYLSGNEDIDYPLYLNTMVYANKPNWTVKTSNFNKSMNLITCAEINGIMADDPEDMVAAFVGNELVGVANLQLFPALGRYIAMMTIYSGSTAASDITFRYWDASTGMVYSNIQIYCKGTNDNDSLVTGFKFRNDAICGSIVSPYLLVMGTEVEQSINIVKGWNWISFNVNPYDNSFTNALTGYMKDIDVIKSQNLFAMSDSVKNVTIGPLDTVRCGPGYRFHALRSTTYKMSGLIADINTYMPLAPNSWTWIGYIPQVAMTTNGALSNINPSIGDIIKGHGSFATWDGAQWVGTLNVMQPGESYSYYNGGASTINLTYPAYSEINADRLPFRIPANVSSHFDPVPIGTYQGNMLMIALVSYNDEFVDNAEVAAFAGSECRAVSIYYEGYYFLTIPGDASTPISLKVAYNDSIYDFPSVFDFETDSIVGDLYNPYEIKIGSAATSVADVKASSAADKVEKVIINNEVFIIRNGEYYDATGRRRNKPNEEE